MSRIYIEEELVKIHEAAQRSGLSAKQIRDYEKLGLLGQMRRSTGNYRIYEEADLQRLVFIRHARAVGFSLAQIRELLALQDDPHRSSQQVKELTGRHIGELRRQIAQLESMVAKLQRWHDHCHGDGSSHCPILEALS